MLQSSALSLKYNALLPIAEAQREYIFRNGDAAVDRLLSIIGTAGFGDEIGIRLLHKHNDISSDELMLESAGFDEEGFALTTSAIPLANADNAVCNSWQYTEAGFSAVEFSEPNVVRLQVNDGPRAYRDLFAELASVINELRVGDILGPSLNYSEYIVQQSPSSDAAFLEKTDFQNRSNVVRYVSRDDPEFTNSAKTKWYAKRFVDPNTKKSTWMTACNCFCSVSPHGGHLGTKTHSYTP